MLPSINTVVTERWHFWHVLTVAITAIGGWKTVETQVRKWAIRAITEMPPLPPDASWNATWFYRIAKTAVPKDTMTQIMASKALQDLQLSLPAQPTQNPAAPKP
jgi:hypothetical protein